MDINENPATTDVDTEGQEPRMRQFEIGFYVRVRMEGVDASDAMHRAENALGLHPERELIDDAGELRGGVTHGRIRYVTLLHRNDPPA